MITEHFNSFDIPGPAALHQRQRAMYRDIWHDIGTLVRFATELGAERVHYTGPPYQAECADKRLYEQCVEVVFAHLTRLGYTVEYERGRTVITF